MRRFVALTALFATLSTGAVARAQAPQPAAKKEPAKKEAEPTTVQSYPVEKCEPTEVQSAIVQAWGRMSKGKEVPALPKLAVNPKGKALIAVGTKSGLEVVSAIVGLVEGEGKDEAAGVAVVRFKHANVNEVLSTLAALGFEDAVVALPKSKAVIVVGAGTEAVANVRQVVALLDKEPAAKPTTKPVATSSDSGK